MLDENEQTDDFERSVYLPGDFRYFHSSHIQDDGEETYRERGNKIQLLFDEWGFR
jgi:hypothetical protein